MHYFWSPNKRIKREEEEEEGGEEEEGETKPRYGFSSLTFVWKLWILA